MKRKRPRARVKRAKPAPAAPAAVSAAPSIDTIQAKLALGKPLGDDERAKVDEVLFEAVPVRRDPDDEPEEGEPDDIACGSQRALADACGVHQNTIGNWKRDGIAPLGEPPFSLKAYFLLLRRRSHLGECKPTRKDALDLWRWAFGAGAGKSLNPDDPVHPPPLDWNGEKDRQGALGALSQRRRLQIEVETLEGARLPTTAVRTTLHDLADEVKGVLAGFLNVPGQVKGLTPEQRADLSDAIQAQIATAQDQLATIKASR